MSFLEVKSTIQDVFSDDLMKEFYDSGWFGLISELAIEVFQKCISAIAQQGKHMIKVLKVGASMINNYHIYAVVCLLIYHSSS
jgi:hypothetical protein